MERSARYGEHLYEVRVAPAVDPKEVVYVYADSLTVTPAGALILSAEVMPLEDAGSDDYKERSGIEVPATFVVAPGLWRSVTEVTEAEDGHRPYFFEGGYFDSLDED